MNEHYTMDKGSYQEEKRESKDPDIEEALSQWSYVEKKVRS
jgi:hypothetical protein